MSASQLTREDLSALFTILKAPLGADDPEELGDRLRTLESKGLVRVEILTDTVKVHLAKMGLQTPVTIRRARSGGANESLQARRAMKHKSPKDR